MKKVIVGLGNPGAEYLATRHNAGVMVVNKLSERRVSAYGWRRKKEVVEWEDEGMVLVKSGEIFMNDSGRMVREAMRQREGELWVVHDDLDIKLGEYKIQRGRGPKDHGGINSIEQVWGNDFWRIRVGIDNRTTAVEGDKYVLERFSREESEILVGVIEKICDEILKTVN